LRREFLTDVAELLHGAELDLANTLSRYVEFGANFF
jgi:hypothetical protein